MVSVGSVAVVIGIGSNASLSASHWAVRLVAPGVCHCVVSLACGSDSSSWLLSTYRMVSLSDCVG